MKALAFIVLPALFQIVVALAFITVRGPGKEFFGLGIMLMSPFCIGLTALLNWYHTYRIPLSDWFRLLYRTLITTAIFPLLCLGFYLLAS